MPRTRSLGVKNDPELDDDVPGTVLLLTGNRNQPLGDTESTHSTEKKRTKDGKIILSPQPMSSPNDPLNWPSWRRDAALLSIGWHCLVGGGQTPILAAGFPAVSKAFDVSMPQVAKSTGLYMLGLGIGCVLLTPIAVKYGKRSIYLFGVLLFMVTSVWAAHANTFSSLLVARIFMGIGVSPCESLPSATIAEIFFLHERAYRLGIYTLLLLGGKNLVPLVSAAIIESLGWRWVFNIVAIIVGFNFILLFLFVPETFWDRTPRPTTRPSFLRRVSSSMSRHSSHSTRSRGKSLDPIQTENEKNDSFNSSKGSTPEKPLTAHAQGMPRRSDVNANITPRKPSLRSSLIGHDIIPHDSQEVAPPLRAAHFDEKVSEEPNHIADEHVAHADNDAALHADQFSRRNSEDSTRINTDNKNSFLQELKIFQGCYDDTPLWKIALRPLALYAYPAILWSAVVYALSVGWLIVLSESVAHIYQANPYNFSPLATGLVYMSPFIGGILGTGVAGKLSDVMVQYMARKNQGIYEPEFRLIMALPVAITTAIGLAGFGWSASLHESWIVPTVFFGILSFGCSLGSTTSITYAVDCYRHYAGEALVTLNFSKNVLHGLVFSLFFNYWLDARGPKTTFLALGIIHIGLLSFSIPLYIYGKRLRAWRSRDAGWFGKLQ